MRLHQLFFIFICGLTLAACAGGEEKLETPLDTLKVYTQAIKRKDTVTMKSLLSKGSLKMAQDEARAQNVSPGDILARETLFTSEQRTLEFRNEKIEGDQATIEVKNTFGTFDKVPFVREDGVWKIAKEKYAEEMMKQADEEMKRLDAEVNQTKQPE